MDEPDGGRQAAAALYNRCWELLDAPTDDDAIVELLTCAFASRRLWRQAGGPDEWVMSDWMVSRAAAASDCGALAVLFARRAHDGLTDSAPDWLRASAAEGLARAYRSSGPADEYDRWSAIAEGLVALIADERDRAVIAGQLAQTRGA